ncbi:hypothetical protein, partial [Allocoleopsis sp.]|uniref:hypothetical protein n=1 Tax=Allocoleopsis sp. TaxID=3088169 RepID=UPI002FCF0D1E
QGRRQKVYYCYVVVSAVNSVLTFMATARSNVGVFRLESPYKAKDTKAGIRILPWYRTSKVVFP